MVKSSQHQMNKIDSAISIPVRPRASAEAISCVRADLILPNDAMFHQITTSGWLTFTNCCWLVMIFRNVNPENGRPALNDLAPGSDPLLLSTLFLSFLPCYPPPYHIAVCCGKRTYAHDHLTSAPPWRATIPRAVKDCALLAP